MHLSSHILLSKPEQNRNTIKKAQKELSIFPIKILNFNYLEKNVE